MNVHELKEKLNELKISNELYSLQGGLPNEKLCLVKEDNWKIYYSERGNRTGEKEYETEEEACEVFLRKVKRYAERV